MNEFAKHILRLIVALALVAGLSGCILRLTGGFVFTDDVGTFIEMIFEDVSVALCNQFFEPETGVETIECQYNIESEDGSRQRTSTARLLSEFGVFGVVVDPVILQVPEGTTVETATVDDGSGPQALRVTETTSFPVTPTRQADAEPGMTFLIVEFPPAIESSLPQVPTAAGPQFDIEFAFRMPVFPSLGSVPVKAMLAGRVEQGGTSYYVPMYPCTSDFTLVPDINIPVTNNLFGFIFTLLNLFFDTENLTCDNEVYDFTEVVTGPIECDADMDGDVDRNDIGAIMARRNTPASGPDDPLDRDGDGVITVLDARQCVLECTSPACAVN